jgi:hypothetical protein
VFIFWRWRRLGEADSENGRERLGSCRTGRLGFFYRLGFARREISSDGEYIGQIHLFFSISHYRSWIRACYSIFIL